MEDNVLNTLLLEVSRAIKPIKEVDSAAKATALMKNLGYQLPGTGEFTGIPVSLLGKVATIAEDIKGLATASSEEARLQAVLKLAFTVKDIAVEIAGMADKMKNAGAAVADFFVKAPVDELPRRLLDYIISVYLETWYGSAYSFLLIAGIVEETEETADIATYRPVFTKRTICWERLPRYITEPRSLAEEIYHWDSGFDSNLFLTRLEKILRHFTLPGGLYNQNTKSRTGLGNAAPDTKEIRIPIFQGGDSPELYSQFGIVISGAEAAGKPKGLALVPYATGVASLPFNLNDYFDIELELSAGIDNGVGIILRPPLSLEFIDNLFTAPGSVGEFKIKVSLKKKAERDQEIYLFGSANSSHLSLKGIGFNVFFSKKQNDIDFGIEAEIREGKVVIGAEGADGFIEQALSGIHMEMDFALGIGFTAKGGFSFRGSGGLEIQIPLHLELGPLQIEGLLLKFHPEGKTFPLIAATTVGLNLGPLNAVVENIGVKLILSFPDGGGNLGPANFELGFQPPNGVGLRIDAGVISGGGYLFFDYEKEEYAGALELTIAGFIAAKAIGLITTRMPDGSKGFSLIIIITVEFMPPFQLGYGFTLIGVGGLLGLNRTVLLDPLREGVRTGTVNNIMFPQNIISNAPRIINDIKTIFPVYEARFLIGPMGKLGWGTPTLISLSFGLIVEIPGNIAILGVLKIVLPDEAAALVRIQVAFVGTIDFDKKMLTFDASLYQSSILTMTLEGDMAVRLKWGDDPNFILSVGGFHPSFTPPPLALPTLRRLALNILNNDNARIRVECYTAVTSNTVQFGAKAELYFGFTAISVEGHIAFDALFQFSPFYFIIQISASVSLKVFGMGLFSISLRFALEGPTPWRAKGSGSISFFFFDVSADFDISWGERKDTALPEIQILPRLLEELNKKELWSTVLTSGKNLLVTLRKPDEATGDALVLHPAGSLVVQQKLLPLGVNIEKVGNQKTSDIRQVNILKATSNGNQLTVRPVNESFARAQYQNLSDAEKLSKPSFEKMAGGVEVSLGENVTRNGKMVRRKVAYEVKIVDKESKRPKIRFFFEIKVLFTTFLRGNSASKSVLSKSHTLTMQPFVQKMDIVEEGFTVAFSSDNKAYNTSSTFESEMMAGSYMQDLIRREPALKKQIHVIPNFELQGK